MKRKIKNKIEKIIKIYNDLFDGTLNIKDNCIISDFFYMYIDDECYVNISPCLNDNYSTYLCLFLVRLFENKISDIKVLEGYFIDLKSKELIPERNLNKEEYEEEYEDVINVKEEENKEFKLMYNDHELNFQFEVLNDSYLKIKYNNNILIKPGDSSVF